MGVTLLPNGVGSSDDNKIDETGVTYGGTLLTATAAELNAFAGGGLDSSEIAILDGATLTTAELNVLDASLNTETILVAGAIDPATRITYIDGSSGVYAVTLAAPDALMLGQVKIIENTVAGNDVTLALTEVQGGSAATTATFNAANETLTLVAGSLKWNVVGEAGVTLS